MFDTVDQILRQLRAGEDSRAKFKRVDFKGRRVLGPDRDNVAAGLGAFANAEGGTFFSASTTPARRRAYLGRSWIWSNSGWSTSPPISAIHRSGPS